jgi:hypothetical protein
MSNNDNSLLAWWDRAVYLWAIEKALKNAAYKYKLQTNVQFSQQENINYGNL